MKKNNTNKNKNNKPREPERDTDRDRDRNRRNDKKDMNQGRRRNDKRDDSQSRSPSPAKRDKVKVPKPAASVSELLRNYKLPTRKGGKLHALLTAMGVIAPELDSWVDPLAHPVAHYVRSLLLLFAARNAADMLPANAKSLTLLDPWGRPFDYSGPKADPGVHAVVRACRPLTFGGDLARVELPSEIPLGCDAAVLVDIYAEGNWKSPLSANRLADIAKLTTLHTVYYVAHMITEMVGAVVHTGQMVQGDHMEVVTSEEERWHLVGDMLHFRADATSVAYGLHPCRNEFLRQRVHAVEGGSLHVNELCILGSMHLWKCVFSPVMPAEIGHTFAEPLRYQEVPLIAMGFHFADRLGTWWRRTTGCATAEEKLWGERHMFKTIDGHMPFDRTAMLQVQDTLRFKLLGGLVLRGAATDTKRYMEHGGSGVWMQAYPDWSAVVAHNTLLMAIMTSSDEVQTLAIDSYRADTTAVEMAKQRISKPVPYPQLGSTWHWPIWLCGFGALLMSALAFGAGQLSASLVWQGVGAGLFSALFEEVFKWIFWPLGLLIGVYEYWLYTRHHGVPARLRISALVLHLATTCLHFCMWHWTALLLHCVFNVVAERLVKPQHWFLVWSRGEQPAMVLSTPLTDERFRAFEASEICSPEHADWRLKDLEIKIDGRPVSLKEADSALRKDACLCFHKGLCSDCQTARATNFAYPLLVVGLLWQPAAGTHSDLAATVMRAYRDPTLGRMASPKLEREFHAETRAALADAATWIGRIHTYACASELLSIRECAASMPRAKGDNLIRTWEQMEVTGTEYLVEMMAKWNETIKSNGVNNNLAGNLTATVKPRVIRNVGTAFQVDTLPEARFLTDFLKQMFNLDREWVVGGRRVIFVVADSTRLTEYLQAMETSSAAVVVVSCDDTMYSAGAQGGPTFPSAFGENDFEMWDQSQTQAFWAWLNYILVIWRFSEVFISQIIVTARAAFRRKRDGFVMKGTAHMCMATGVSVTSIVGSLFNIMLWVKALQENQCFQTSCRQVGVGAKLLHMDSIHGMTFLKGWATVDNDGATVWANLPSCVLKMGKLFRDPVKMAKQAGFDLNRNAATIVCAHAVCSSFVDMALDYPIVGALVRKVTQLKRAAGNATVVMTDFVAENTLYKVRQIKGASRSFTLALMFSRYGISSLEVEECEALIDKVTTLPWLVSCPAVHKLCLGDYS